MWRSASLITSFYLVLAIIMISLAYPQPDYSGLVAPRDFRVIFYSDSPRLAVLSSGNSTILYVSGYVYRLNAPASYACFNRSHLIVGLPNGFAFISSTVVLTISTLNLSGILAGLSCNWTPYAILVSIDGVFLVDLKDGLVFRLPNLTISGYVSLLPTPKGVYVASGSSVVLVNLSGTFIYRLPGVISIHGLTLSHEGLVAYGSWGDSGLIYRFNVGEAMLLSLPGRITSVDALTCFDYRCLAIIRPYGDWLIVVEFNNWRYTSHAKIITIRSFVYHASGSSDRVWISGELADLGVIVLGVHSTREAVIGFNNTHAVAWTESYITPAPRLSKIKVYPSTWRTNINSFKIEFSETNGSVGYSDIRLSIVEAQVDRLSTLITLIVVTLPLLAYIYNLTIKSSGAVMKLPVRS